MSKSLARGARRSLAALVTVLTVSAFLAPAANADPPVRLVLAASADSSTRLVGVPFTFSLSITNVSDRPVDHATVDATRLSGSFLDISDWNGLAPGGPGVTIDAGTTRAFTLTARVYQWLGQPLTRFIGRGVAEFEQRPAELAIPMLDPATKGTGSGVIYGDRNGNHVFDPGEEIANATAAIFSPDGRFEAVTDAAGRFTFTDVPARRYDISTADLPDGWVHPYERLTIDIDGGTHPDVLLRTVRPFSDQLRVSASVDKDLYQPGDPVQVAITLTNVSDATLPEIVMGCDRAGDSPQHIAGWKSWADLAYPARLTLAPGESRTFHETGTVPAAASQYGGFGVWCDFGPLDGEILGYPETDLWTHVPGPAADTSLSIYHDDNLNSVQDPGEEVADTALSLVDVADDRTVATGRTDARGHVAFSKVPAGLYLVRIDGWVPAGGRGTIPVGTCPVCGGGWAMTVKHAS